MLRLFAFVTTGLNGSLRALRGSPEQAAESSAAGSAYGRDACHLFACGSETFVVASISRGWDELGQMVQRVVEVIGVERRKPNVLAESRRHRGPVVGELDLGLGLSERREIVAPDPPAELELAVPSWNVARLPGDGVWRVEGHDLARADAPAGQKSSVISHALASAHRDGDGSRCRERKVLAHEDCLIVPAWEGPLPSAT